MVTAFVLSRPASREVPARMPRTLQSQSITKWRRRLGWSVRHRSGPAPVRSGTTRGRLGSTQQPASNECLLFIYPKHTKTKHTNHIRKWRGESTRARPQKSNIKAPFVLNIHQNKSPVCSTSRDVCSDSSNGRRSRPIGCCYRADVANRENWMWLKAIAMVTEFGKTEGFTLNGLHLTLNLWFYQFVNRRFRWVLNK